MVLKHHQEEILLKLINSDENSFRSIFDQYSPQVYAIALKYLKTVDLANDVVQETFLKLWNYRSNIDEKQPIKPLIVTFAKRTILNLIRDERRKILRHIKGQELQTFAGNYTEEAISFNEVSEVYQEAIRSLPGKRKEIYLLKTSDGLSNEAVAQKMKISVHTVKSQYSKALKAIQRLVSLHYSSLIIAVLSEYFLAE